MSSSVVTLTLEAKPGALIPTALLVGFTVFKFGWTVGLVICSVVAVSLVIHELGHVIAARSAGVRVKAIGICLLGPYTRRESSGNPFREFCIAMAGPAANFLVALFLWQYGPVARGMAELNLTIGLLNLIPIRPSDGWRALDSFVHLISQA